MFYERTGFYLADLGVLDAVGQLRNLFVVPFGHTETLTGIEEILEDYDAGK